MLAAYVSAQSGEQHSCIDLAKLGQPFLGVYRFPELSTLLSYIQNAHTFARLSAADVNLDTQMAKPIILQDGKLYLQRYWQYESQLAVIIREKSIKKLDLDITAVQALLGDLFDEEHDKITNQVLDWQKIAVCIAASQSVSFITGGPGTGKTTTVTKLLALLQGLAAKKGKILNIQLVAPTGKAAARLTESISAAKLKLPTVLQANLPEQCQTIHRLLGAKPQSPYFRANASHPLHLDVLVLDEASMVDLPLMAKLFAALPKDAQIILLGDQDQLASVETGSVLSDICAASNFHGDNMNDSYNALLAYSDSMQQLLAKLISAVASSNLQTVADKTTQQSSITGNTTQGNVIQDNVVKLLKSHRFGENSGIGQLAKQVKAGQVNQSFSLLNDEQFTDINWHLPVQGTSQTVATEILKTLIVKLLPIYQQYTQAIHQGDLRQAFKYLHQQQVLCAQKTGYWGVAQLNALIELELHKQGLIDNSKDFYIGRPVMLSKNDHQLKLFNGDVGIVMADPNNTALTKVWFVTPEGELRGLLPSRLPSLETLYAMTIHKSQGSEFESVYLCLPLISANNQGRGLNRELIYTGLTRAKQYFMLFGEQKALSLSLSQQCVRGSGLAGRLLG
jgi:exodeoxyribonuclease V alpha subunit